MIHLTDSPFLTTHSTYSRSLLAPARRPLQRDFGIICTTSAKIYVPSSSDVQNPIMVFAVRKDGAALGDMSVTWGSVEGVRLLVMKKEWLHHNYKKFHDQGDGEWFVTTCLIAGMKKDYAIALRTALLHALKLPVNGDRPMEEVQREWEALWNRDAVHQEAEEILAGRHPTGVEIRYRGQTELNWYLPPGFRPPEEDLKRLRASLPEPQRQLEISDRCAPPAQPPAKENRQKQAARFEKYGAKTFACAPRLSGFAAISCDVFSQEVAMLAIQQRHPLAGSAACVHLQLQYSWRDYSLIFGCMPGGAALSDVSLTWGSVDGVRLVVLKKEWLDDEYKGFYDKGDGEWFVTTCLIAGMEKDYAIALRTALLRALKLPLDGSRLIKKVEKEWQARWNADTVHKEAEDILAGRSPKGVEIRYVGQKQPNWWLSPAPRTELNNESGAVAPLTGGMTLFKSKAAPAAALKQTVTPPLNKGVPSHFLPQGDKLFLEAVAKGDLGTVVQMVQDGVSVTVQAVYAAHKQPLHIACAHQQTAMVEQLLAWGADPNAKTDRGFTPLHVAAQQGDCETALLLLKAGANLQAVTDQGMGTTPLQEAAHKGQVTIVTLFLMAGAEASYQEKQYSMTARDLAQHAGQKEAVLALLGYQAAFIERLHRIFAQWQPVFSGQTASARYYQSLKNIVCETTADHYCWALQRELDKHYELITAIYPFRQAIVEVMKQYHADKTLENRVQSVLRRESKSSMTVGLKERTERVSTTPTFFTPIPETGISGGMGIRHGTQKESVPATGLNRGLSKNKKRKEKKKNNPEGVELAAPEPVSNNISNQHVKP